MASMKVVMLLTVLPLHGSADGNIQEEAATCTEQNSSTLLLQTKIQVGGHATHQSQMPASTETSSRRRREYVVDMGPVCRAGYMPITSGWQDCEEACRSLGLGSDPCNHVDYRATSCSHFRNRPQGCFRSGGNRRVHFNCGDGGTANPGDEIICTRDRITEARSMTCEILLGSLGENECPGGAFRLLDQTTCIGDGGNTRNYPMAPYGCLEDDRDNRYWNTAEDNGKFSEFKPVCCQKLWHCSSNSDCDFPESGWYCNYEGRCVQYHRDYCKWNTCGMNDGDCDNDAQCLDGLQCGTNNCPAGFSGNADCCESAYELVGSETECDRVTSLSECSRAAEVLKLTDTTAEDDEEHFPNGAVGNPTGCYFMSPHLLFDSEFRNEGRCREDRRCLCRKKALPMCHVEFWREIDGVDPGPTPVRHGSNANFGCHTSTAMFVTANVNAEFCCNRMCNRCRSWSGNYYVCDCAPALVNRGKSGCTRLMPCSRCQGDCDSDEDCAGELRCFQRDGLTSITGCPVPLSGRHFNVANYDYCVLPT